MRFFYTCWSLLLILPGISQAATEAASSAAPAISTPAAAPSSPGTAGMGSEAIMEMVLGLLAVIAMIFLVAWGVRRLGGGAWGQARGMRVLSTLPLGTRERVVLVQAGERQLLLGVAPGRVTLLESFDEPILTTADQDTGAAFSKRLKDAMAGRSLQR